MQDIFIKVFNIFLFPGAIFVQQVPSKIFIQSKSNADNIQRVHFSLFSIAFP